MYITGAHHADGTLAILVLLEMLNFQKGIRWRQYGRHSQMADYQHNGVHWVLMHVCDV